MIRGLQRALFWSNPIRLGPFFFSSPLSSLISPYKWPEKNGDLLRIDMDSYTLLASSNLLTETKNLGDSFTKRRNGKYNWGSGSIGRANYLEKHEVAHRGGERSLQSKKEHCRIDGSKAQIKASSQDRPLAPPEVSKTHPENWANQIAKEVETRLQAE